MEGVPRILEDSNKKFSALVKKPEKLLEKDSDLIARTKLLTKVIYDVSKLLEPNPCHRTLPELIVDGFDCEQVWAGVELQNQARLSELESRLAKVDLAALSQCPLLLGRPKPVKGQQPEEEEEDDVMGDFDALEEEEVEDMEEEKLGSHTDEEEDDNDKGDDKEGDDLLNDPDFQNMSDSDGDDLPLFGDLSDDEQDEDEGTEGTFKERERKGGGSGRATQVDDQFFKLSDMEKFLEVEDRKWESKDGGASEQTFLDLDDEGEEDSDPRVMYSAFFDDQEANEEGDDVDGKSDSDDAEEGEEDDDDDDDDDDDEEEEGENSQNDLAGGQKKPRKLLPSDDEDSDEEQVVKSKHEVQQERLAKKIAHLEEAAVGSKPWQMGGEVAAPSRGENSLLAEDLEYDTAVRQAPVVTEDVARALEDIIRQRVKDKAWDDVERKVRPVEDPREYKKKLVLDQEKSKLSLAQVYEEEYVKLAEGAEAAKSRTSIGLLDKEVEETPEAVKEIKESMHVLFRKLDSLTHLHYTPKQKSAELKIVRNIPTINMEEVAPVAASNATLLAPAEVVDKQKGELMDSKEKSETDRKRERREKKAKKSAIRKNKEKKAALEEAINPGGLGNKFSKARAMKKVEEAEKQGKKVETIKGKKDKALNSSTAFFSSLQDEVKTGAKEKAHAKKKKKALKDLNAASLKL